MRCLHKCQPSLSGVSSLCSKDPVLTYGAHFTLATVSVKEVGAAQNCSPWHGWNLRMWAGPKGISTWSILASLAPTHNMHKSVFHTWCRRVSGTSSCPCYLASSKVKPSIPYFLLLSPLILYFPHVCASRHLGWHLPDWLTYTSKQGFYGINNLALPGLRLNAIDQSLR